MTYPYDGSFLGNEMLAQIARGPGPYGLVLSLETYDTRVRTLYERAAEDRGAVAGFNEGYDEGVSDERSLGPRKMERFKEALNSLRQSTP